MTLSSAKNIKNNSDIMQVISTQNSVSAYTRAFFISWLLFGIIHCV